MQDKTTTIEKLANAYEGKPLIRALVQLALAPIPYGIGSAIDDALTTSITNMREKRLRIFFDELAAGKHPLTEELIQKEDFLHAYYSTLKAASNSNHAEKIRLFARLLLNASQSDFADMDSCEEFISILEDLSVRELHILAILMEFEDANYPKSGKTIVVSEEKNELQQASSFWKDFEETVRVKLGIDSNDLRAMLTRLNRTGLYENFAGMYLDYTGGIGKLTSLFYKFVDCLNMKEMLQGK